MHELGITQEILEIVAERAQERKVKRVVLEIGKLSCVLPDAIRFCFDMCAEGTIAEGAALEIIQPPGIGQCRLCGVEFEMERVIARCACGSTDIEWLAGEELRIKTMEVA
jgi:hydrogenase nickel incorporation protein HypA/HybF